MANGSSIGAYIQVNTNVIAWKDHQPWAAGDILRVDYVDDVGIGLDYNNNVSGKNYISFFPWHAIERIDLAGGQ